LPEAARHESVQPIKVWRCVGCGRLDHPQPCIGVCRDEKVEIVFAADYQAALERIGALEVVLQRIVHTTPRADAWEASYRALQGQARAALGG